MTLLKKVKTMSKEEIGKHLFLAIVQTKNNHALLEHCIHRKFLDLSVLCNYEFSVGKELKYWIKQNAIGSDSVIGRGSI